MEEKWFANEIQDSLFKAKEKRASQRTAQGKNAKNNKNQGKANNKIIIKNTRKWLCFTV